MTSGRHKKYTEDDIESLGEKLIACAQRDGVYHVTEFSEDFGKSPTWVYKLAEDYPLFGQYLTRATKILGRKMMKLAWEGNPSMYMQKTFIKRYLTTEYEDIEKFVKDDIEMEAQAKAEAVKQANLAEVSPIAMELIDKLDRMKLYDKSSQH